MCVTKYSSWLRGLQQWTISSTSSRSRTTIFVEGLTLSSGETYVLTNTRSGNHFLLGPMPVDLGGGAGAITTPDRAPIPTSSTFGGLAAGTPSSIGVLVSLRQTPKVGWSLEDRSGDSTETVA